MFIAGLGALFFGLTIGWITYRIRVESVYLSVF